MRTIEIKLANRYQIGRHDSRNLVIRKWIKSEKSPPGYWVVHSYHGNSLKSLSMGVNEITTENIVPFCFNPLETLVKAELEQVRLLARIEKQLGILLGEKI